MPQPTSHALLRRILKDLEGLPPPKDLEAAADAAVPISKIRKRTEELKRKRAAAGPPTLDEPAK